MRGRKVIGTLLVCIACAGGVLAQKSVKFTRLRATSTTAQGLRITTFPSSPILFTKSLEIQSVAPMQLEVSIPVSLEEQRVYQVESVELAIEHQEVREFKSSEKLAARRYVMPVRSGSTKVIVVDCNAGGHKPHRECIEHAHGHGHVHNYCDEEEHKVDPMCRKDE